MRNASFIKRFLGRKLMVAGLGIGFLMMGVLQVQAQNGPPNDGNPRFNVTNLACGIQENGTPTFKVAALSSTDLCVLRDVAEGNDCAEALQFIMGSRKFKIEAGGGGGVASGISEALVTTAGIVYTLTRSSGLSRGGQLEECAIVD